MELYYLESANDDMKEKEPSLCKNCIHYAHCGIKNSEQVFHCEIFEFKEKEEE